MLSRLRRVLQPPRIPATSAAQSRFTIWRAKAFASSTPPTSFGKRQTGRLTESICSRTPRASFTARACQRTKRNRKNCFSTPPTNATTTTACRPTANCWHCLRNMLSSPESQVFVASSDGTKPRLLTANHPSYFHGWSPDGKWLAFVGKRDGSHFNIFRIGVDGGSEQQLTSNPANDDGPVLFA